jgi:m7GpppX diphosphatase
METINPLKSFKLEKILFKNNDKYTTTLYGLIDDKPAIVILQKLSWNDSTRESFFENIISHNIKISNGKWLNMLCSFKDDIISNIICPASEEDIIKYSPQENINMSEPIEYYYKYSVPFIQDSILNNKPDLSWIHRILIGESEQNRILYNDPIDFVFVKGFKWLSENTTDFSGLVIVRAKELYLLRDINGDHIELLEKIRMIIYQTVYEKYKLSYEKLRIFIHYHPTFYHFHIHVNVITNSQGWDAGRCHMLDTIISNIKINPNYYQLCTLNFETQLNSLFLKHVENHNTL